MSGYGNPILQTADPIGNALPLLMRVLDDRQQRDFRRQALDRQDAEFAYRQQQDAQALGQGRMDAQAIAAAMGGGQPNTQGVSAGGLSKIAEIQQRAEMARSAKLDKTLQFLEPHVLNGSKMAQHNYDRAMSEYFGEDFTGSGEALRAGQFDKFVQQKQLEKQIALEAKMAEQEMMRQMQAPENLARVRLAGMPTAGLDGTMGPPDAMAEALYNADPATARGYMDDQRAAAAAKEKATAGQMRPDEFETAVRRYMVNNQHKTRAQAEADVGGMTGYGQGGKRTMTLDSADGNGNVNPYDIKRQEVMVKEAEDRRDELRKQLSDFSLIDKAQRKDEYASLSEQYNAAKADVSAARSGLMKLYGSGGGAANSGPTTGQPGANAGQPAAVANPKDEAKARFRAHNGRDPDPTNPTDVAAMKAIFRSVTGGG